MLKIIATVMFLVCILSFQSMASYYPAVSAENAVLIAADSKEVIFAKNEHERRGIASTTKIMTALLMLECATPQKQVVVTEQMVAVEGTSMGLLPGDKVTYRDLVYGMLLASGNDAANTAAISVAGSLSEFALMMNERAQQIGMFNTNFVTPSGLDADTHYSTAYDMALLACEAIKNPDFLEACSSVQAKLCYGNEPYTRYLTNHNRLLKSFDGAIGIKTGFTKKSGRCLVSAAERDGITLVCVTLNAPNDWQDHQALLEYGFSKVSTKYIDCEFPSVNVFGGVSDTAELELSDSLNIPTFCNSKSVETKIAVKPYCIAPLEKGDIVGEVRLIIDGKTVKTVSLVAKQSVVATTKEVIKKHNLIDRIITWIMHFFD